MAVTPTELSSYRDQHFKGTRTEQEKLLKLTTTLYVGNMSFYTTEEQLYELFGKCGDVKRIVMGLDKFKRTPCGFCFVEYYLVRIDIKILTILTLFILMKFRDY